jgi:hypothetical protein
MKLLITLMLVSANVFANGITAKGEQSNGVVIALTDEPCRIKNTFAAYNIEKDGFTTNGCWAADESIVLIRWDGGHFSSFPFAFFDPKRNTSNEKDLQCDGVRTARCMR